MNPQLKRWIIIANIVTYVIVCVGIYARRKGGFNKAFVPKKKVTIEEVIARKKEAPVPPAGAVAKAPPAVGKKPAVPVLPFAPKPPSVTPPAPTTAAVEGMPAHIKDAEVMLENMRIKEQQLRFNYYSVNRDPFVSLVGIDNYLAQAKFTPDEYADLPPGLPIKTKQKSSPFTLFGTIKSRDGESTAIINNQVLNEGDIIDGYKVTKIEKKSVTLASGKKVIKLQMLKDESRSETDIMQRLKEATQ